MSIACKQLTKWPTEATKRLAWPLRDKTQMGTAQDVADDLSFFFEQLTTLTSFCVCIIAAKLRVKL